MVQLLEIGVLGISRPIKSWWQWAFIGITAATALVGLLSFLFVLFSTIRGWAKRDRLSKSIPPRLQAYLNFHINSSSPVAHKKDRLKPSSFGVYLGQFASPPTEAQAGLLSRWDILILDPLQPGVLDAVTSTCPSVRHTLIGRLHFRSLHEPIHHFNEQHIMRAIEKVREAVQVGFKHSSCQTSPFTGVLLAGWEGWLPVPIFDALSQYLISLGLDVYLEISPPNFLGTREFPNMGALAGVVVRNGTILRNGLSRDYFQMSEMKSTIKAFVTQSCLRDFRVMMWETVDDQSLSHAVIKRCYTWCSYYSAIVFICSKSSLLNAATNVGVPEPLAAFQWLKDPRVMKIHNIWRSTHKLISRPTITSSAFKKLETIVPSLHYLASTFGYYEQNHDRCSSVTTLTGQIHGDNDISEWPLQTSHIMSHDVDMGRQWFTQFPRIRGNPLSFSPSGESNNLLGCFPVGLHASPDDFKQIVQGQRHLKRLALLDRVSPSKLRNIGSFFRRLHDAGCLHNSLHIDRPAIKSINELAQHLWAASDSDKIMDPIQVYLGLDTGFRRPGDVQFWAVYDTDVTTGELTIYVSKKAHNLEGTILHAFMSSQGCPRHTCFAAELAAAEYAGEQSRPSLPRRLVQDIGLLSPADIIFFLQHLKLSEWDKRDTLLMRINSACEEQLLERPSFAQLKEFDTVGYLSGRISERELLESRSVWYQNHGYQNLDYATALAIFTDVRVSFLEILCSRRYEDLDQFSETLESVIASDGFDAYSDLVALAVFCAARKAAFDEIYLEVSDRNPLFNEYSDQAGAFAELFALGSRCEDYFDLTPSAFGKLLSHRHRAHYGKPHNQPPLQIESAASPASSYAVAQIDIDMDAILSVMPGYQRLTFLSVFAIPAFVDITLLTTTGHGLYLSAFMSPSDLSSATLALMMSLPLSSAIGTWVSIGGGYYLNSMAFPAANMFVITRLIGGLVFTIVGGLAGMVMIISITCFQDGVVFLLYFVAFTSYLSLSAVLSIYQFLGSSFQNGRSVILCAIPLLTVSPIISIWVPNHDTPIYIFTLYMFIGVLTIGARRVGSQWVTWYQKINPIDDKAVKGWYVTAKGHGDQEILSGMTDLAALCLARGTLLNDVEKERKKRLWAKPTTDSFVLQLANSWDATVFLLDWYCRLQGSQRPIPYSSTWNIQVKVALDSLLQAQKGIRLHNAFVLWRQAGDEIGCSILYFLVALLDRWIDILSGGNLLGFSGPITSSFRKSMGLGLAYYLIGAVILDYKAHHLNGFSEKQDSAPIRSARFIREAVVKDAKKRQRLYFGTLGKFLSVHVWSLAVTATLVWILDGSQEALVMFLAYVGAYTGLLLYQYNKIFSGPQTLIPLLLAITVALPLGLAMKIYLPHFQFNTVIPLGVATWMAAFLSLKTADIGIPKEFKHDVPGLRGTFHAYGGLGLDQDWSQSELEEFFDATLTTSAALPFRIESNSCLGRGVKAVLMSCSRQFLSRPALQAFPDALHLVSEISRKWDDGKIRVELGPVQSITSPEADVRALSCFSDGLLRVLVNNADMGNSEQPQCIDSNYHYIAEILLHAGAEFLFGMSHDSSLLAESLPTCRSDCRNDAFNIPEGVKRATAQNLSPDKCIATIAMCKKQLLQQLCFGLQCDIVWDNLPSNIRSLLLHRCLGERHYITASDLLWLKRVLAVEAGLDMPSFIARCDLSALLSVNKIKYFESLESNCLSKKSRRSPADLQSSSSHSQQHLRHSRTKSNREYISAPFIAIYRSLGVWFKFFIVSLTADPEFQRELKFVLSRKSPIVANMATFLLTVVWISGKKAQNLILPWFLFHEREKARKVWDGAKGTVVSLEKNRLVIQSLDDTSTSFFHIRPGGDFKLCRYTGLHDKEPEGASGLKSINHFSAQMILQSREEYVNQALVNEYQYGYATAQAHGQSLFRKADSPRMPVSRTCIRGQNEFEIVYFNKKGFIESGSYLLDDSLVRFKYNYRKNAKFDDELLRAEFVLPHVTCNVNWCAPPVRHPGKMERWIPNSRVSEATFVRGSDVYESSWFYDHQHHPTITTMLNGNRVETPDMILHDWLGVLKKPKNCNFALDNPLVEFSSLKTNVLSRLMRRNIKRYPISTSRARSQLWRAWKNDSDLDGVLTRWLDEKLLRDNALLKIYWQRRDRGALVRAEGYLALHTDAITASSELSKDISSWTPLAIKLGDLFSFGQGGDALMFTRTQSLQPDTNDKLSVMAVDTGTWPNEGGGVSACRRDMVNNLRTVKWHMLVESATDFGLPKHQIEENVQSLKVIPLWGLDFLHPVHGVFHNKLDSEVDRIPKNANYEDIQKNFIPALTALVKGARAVCLSNSDIKQTTRALVNLNTYFQDSRHWASVWTSDTVKQSWRNLWLSEDLPNTKPPSEWFETELPTLGHLDAAMELWYRYLFIFSIPVPEKIPSVFQASHHSVSASYGIVCKMKRQCTLQIWDHAISWRETNLYLSSALCVLPSFVRNSLLSLMRLTSVLALHHADQILPCADFFNIGWEVEIGSLQGTLEHRNRFRRKVDPVVNGITDMKKFSPVTEIKTEKPTVTMLSHVWFAKDIKTAILAANVIVNEWGFKDYQLDIYGALDKAPVYSAECQEILASKSLRGNVSLKGTADPKVVLSNSWLFLNSSISEGLPLALGEAALTGVPVVCTDVGASLRVLTDPDDNARYSEVVAPNDAQSLARAQISLLAMIGKWSAYADDGPGDPVPVLPFKPGPADIARITQRMYEKTPQRRKLGMMARNIVQKSFSGDRYLREHEQMLWIGKAWAVMEQGEDITDITSRMNSAFAPATTLVAPNPISTRSPSARTSFTSADNDATLPTPMRSKSSAAETWKTTPDMQLPQPISPRFSGLEGITTKKWNHQRSYSRSQLSTVSTLV